MSITLAASRARPARRLVAALATGVMALFWADTAPAQTAYVSNNGTRSVSVIRTSDNALLAPVTLPLGSNPYGVAVTPDGARVYIANNNSDTVSVIRTSDNVLLSPVALPAFSGPLGVAITPDGARVYVANGAGFGNSVSVIRTSDNTLLAPVILPNGSNPTAFGKFIGPAPAPPITVPTMSEWAMILFGLTMACSAAVAIHRRRQFG